MVANEVRLLGVWGSPFSRRVEMALNLKGVRYEFIEEDLNNKSPSLLEYNPVHKKIPVLIHNGKPIAESLNIVEYIDEAWPEGPPILPKDPYQRAEARFWANFIDEKFMPVAWKACWSSGEERVKGVEEAIELLKFLDAEVKGKKFFGGNEIGFLDIAANFIGYFFGIICELVDVKIITEENHPNLWQWIKEYNSSSFVKENLPEKDEYVKKVKARFLPDQQ